MTGTNTYAFSLRWPPALPSAHLGDLSLFDPGQLAALLAELGPVLLLLPLATWYAWRAIRRGDWLKAGVGLAGALSFIFPFFIQYGVDRSSTRLPATALWIWLVLGFPLLVNAYRRGRQVVRVLLGAGYVVTALGGVVTLAVMLAAVQVPQSSYFITSEDVILTNRYWNQLDPQAQVLDELPERAITIFGRASHARPHIYDAFPDFQALVANPDPTAAARAGYGYIYMNNSWWERLSAAQKQALDQSCVRQMVTGQQELDRKRWVIDIRSCR